jgi:hypothetical protein
VTIIIDPFHIHSISIHSHLQFVVGLVVLGRIRQATIAATGLLEHTINLILIIQFQHLGCLIVQDALSIQQETQACRLHALALGIRLEYLGHFGRFLDFEKGFFTSL